jgi:hypothetical protein
MHYLFKMLRENLKMHLVLITKRFLVTVACTFVLVGSNSLDCYYSNFVFYILLFFMHQKIVNSIIITIFYCSMLKQRDLSGSSKLKRTLSLHITQVKLILI